MFVYLRRGWYGAVALASTLAIGACGPGNQTSTLRPDGPPEVLTVSLPGPDPRIALGEEPSGSIIEVATFCKTSGPNDGTAGAGDPKRPSTVTPNDLNVLQYCPNDDTKPQPELTAADPTTWFVRIQFDELLDPSIEDLVPSAAMDGTTMGTLKNTQPVTMQCQSATGNGAMVDITYDGYYDPSGNSESYPVGPSLVIQPSDPTLVATGSQCQITLKDNIKDKDGNSVPMDQRGPYTWSIGTIGVTAIQPADMSMVDPAAAGVDLTFNAVIDPASIVMASTISPTVPNLGNNPTTIQEAANEVFIGGDFPAGAGPFTYKLTAVSDQCGKSTNLGTPSVDNNTQTSFSTNPIMINGITGADDPGSKVAISFNQFMDPNSLTQFTITPALSDTAIAAFGGSSLIIDGTSIDPMTGAVLAAAYKLGTTYTFTLTANAAIKDCPGIEFDPMTGACTSTNTTTFNSGPAQTVMFTTASAIALNNVAPMDNSTIGPTDTVDLTFNQTITDASVAAAIAAGNITVSPAVTLAELSDGAEDVQIGPMSGTWAPGDYTFTIKAAASFSDGIMGDAAFTPGMDQVIHFTVPMPGTAPACF